MATKNGEEGSGRAIRLAAEPFSLPTARWVH